MDEINLNGAANSGNSSSDDEVVVDEELTEAKESLNRTSTSNAILSNGFAGSEDISGLDDLNQHDKSSDTSFFRFDTPDNEDLFADRRLPEWVGWGGPSNLQVGGTSFNPFIDQSNSGDYLSSQADEVMSDVKSPSSEDSILANGSRNSKSPGSSDASMRSPIVHSLFEEDVEFVGVELEGTEKAMEHALKEGIVGEAGPLKRNIATKVTENDTCDTSGAGTKEFNDANYWRVDQEVAVSE